MQSDDYQEVIELFQQAVKLPLEQRVAFLDEKCAGRPQLRSQIEGMLRQDVDSSLAADSGLPGSDVTLAYEETTTKSPKPNETIGQLGNYELLEEIARGGMGVVFKARHRELDRVVAIKLILGSRHASAEAIRRFQAEAQAAAKLDHPGLVPVYEVGVEDDQHFFAMGFVEGESLDAHLKSAGKLPPDEAARIVKQLAEAVEYAHRHRVIHRDLKPSNVLMDEDGRPRITDFGLAKRVGDEEHLTMTGDILGTPSYMSPEQASGGATAVERQTDIYSLGAILYALLTGRPPFDGDSIFDTINQILENEPISPRTISRKIDKPLEVICLKCLSKKPEHRYQTAGGLADDLGHYLDGEAIHAKPANTVQRLARAGRRYPGFTVVLVPLCLLYAYHLFVAFVLRESDSLEPFFHWFSTGLVVVWIASAWLFQQLQLRRGRFVWIAVAWTTLDVVFLTSYLFIASRYEPSPHYIAYICLVAASAVRFRVSVQYYTTAICAAAYLLYVWKGMPGKEPRFPDTLFQVVPFLVQLFAVGLIQAILLRRIRRVDRLQS